MQVSCVQKAKTMSHPVFWYAALQSDMWQSSGSAVSPQDEELHDAAGSDTITATMPARVPSLAIEASICPKLSYATHQSAVPVLRELRVVNNAEVAFEELELEISADPPVFIPRRWQLDRLQPGSCTVIRNRDLELNASFLLGLQEAVHARVLLKLWPDSAPGDTADCLATESYPVEILAASEWGGAGSMAELLAMFVQPNDTAIARILKASAEVLHNAGKPDKLDGYEAKSRARSYELASAIWSAISSLRLTYALPPASFETQGQKIRAPQQVVEHGLATCLDTALLFAAALEQIGLNPVVILTQGHAFTGVWLQPQEFASLITEDASALRKRVALQELLVFETTLCMQGNRPGFSKAIAEGNRQIAEEREAEFVMALDLRRARMQRLRPLALPTIATAGSQSASLPAGVDDAKLSLEAAPALPAFDVTDFETASTPEGRLQR